jgi:hypothetical protein
VFFGRLAHGHRLAPGNYVVVIRAASPFGGASASKTLSFRIAG